MIFMFGNFLYFIIILLIYTTAPSPQESNFPLAESLEIFLALVAVFALFTRFEFQRLEKRICTDSFFQSDHRFNSLITRHSIIAIAVFAIDIYWLNLPTFAAPFFSILPTLQALLFIGIFVGYLAMIWAFAYPSYRLLYNSELSGRGYVTSNISFALPVLLPWLILSLVSDIIQVLPFEPLKQFLSTTVGEISYFLFFLFATAIAGPALIQKFWQCTPLEDCWERRRIEALCQRAGLEYADILYWPIFEGRMITAGVMGLIRRFRYILVTKALLTHLSIDEIESVIAHEIGHVKKRHLLFYLFFFIGYMLLSYTVFDLAVYGLMYIEPLYRMVNVAGFSQTAFSAWVSIVIILIFLIYFRFIFGYFMRNFERQADTYIYNLFDNAVPLISTFEKITLTSGQSPDKPNWHHFSITERVDYLKKCETDRGWIDRHDKKIRKSIAVYLAGILLIGGVGFHLNFTESGRKFNSRLLEKIVVREIEKNPKNARLYGVLGDMYYTQKNYKKTMETYEKSLELEPDNPHVLNNLAWLYATVENKKLRDSERAVELAQRAAAILQAPYILDTLAESYYANKDYEKAASVSKKAIEIATRDRAYYESQFKKFMRAVIEADRSIKI